MKQSILPVLLIILFASCYNFNLLSMEITLSLVELRKLDKDTITSELDDLFQQKNKIIAKGLRQLARILPLNRSLLSEPDLSRKTKKSIRKKHHRTKASIKKMKKLNLDSSNNIAFDMKATYQNTKTFILMLEERIHDPIIKKHIKSYYELFGKLTLTKVKIKNSIALIDTKYSEYVLVQLQPVFGGKEKD